MFCEDHCYQIWTFLWLKELGCIVDTYVICFFLFVHWSNPPGLLRLVHVSLPCSKTSDCIILQCVKCCAVALHYKLTILKCNHIKKKVHEIICLKPRNATCFKWYGILNWKDVNCTLKTQSAALSKEQQILGSLFSVLVYLVGGSLIIFSSHCSRYELCTDFVLNSICQVGTKCRLSGYSILLTIEDVWNYTECDCGEITI